MSPSARKAFEEQHVIFVDEIDSIAATHRLMSTLRRTACFQASALHENHNHKKNTMMQSHAPTVSHTVSEWTASSGLPTTTHDWLADVLERQQGSLSGNLSCVTSWARASLLEATEPALAEMLQDIDLHKKSMRARGNYNALPAHLPCTAAVQDKPSSQVANAVHMLPEIGYDTQPGTMAKAPQADALPTKSQKHSSVMHSSTGSRQHRLEKEKDSDLVHMLTEIRRLKKTLLVHKPTLSRSDSFDLAAESYCDSSDSFHRTNSEPTRRQPPGPHKIEHRHQRSLESLSQARLSRKPRDSVEHSPGSPWHLKNQHQEQQFFLNRRAALYRPSTPMIKYSLASSNHSTAKTIKKACHVPQG